MEYTKYLSKVIGPRPAGTEEEQQAALYITEQFQKEAGFSANIEEFKQSTRPDLSAAILSTVAVVLTLVSMLLPMVMIPVFIVNAILAVVFVVEAMGHPLLSHALARGASQNVIAKYQPNVEDEGASRSVTRKLIVVAHYDSGHVVPPLVKRLDSMKISFNLISAYVVVALAVLVFIRIFVAIIGGGVLVILNILSVIAMLLGLLPVIKFFLQNNAPYNEGANNNATGVAALIELASRISNGSVSEADLSGYADEVVIHGAQAAESEGLVPEGASLVYEAAETEVPAGSLQSEEERLLAAKAAVAALTGRPVENRVYAKTDEAVDASASAQLGETIQMNMEEFMARERELAEGAGAAATGIAEEVGAIASDASALVEMAPDAPFPPSAESLIANAVSAEEAEADDSVSGFQNAPSWFVAAQKNAKRNTNSAPAEIHRSRYTEALEHAEAERIQREQAALAEEQARLEAERLARETEARLALESQIQEAEEAKAAATLEAQVLEAEAADLPSDADVEVVVEAEAEVVPEFEQQPMAEAEAASAAQLPRYVDDASAAREVTLEAAAEVEAVAVADEPEAATITAAEIFETDHAAASEGGAAPSRIERLKSLRTSIPSLSGIIRTKDEARKTAADSIPNPLDTPASGTASAARTMQAVAGGHAPAAASESEAATPAPQTRGAKVDIPQVRTSEVDYDMVLSDLGGDIADEFAGGFAATYEDDFAEELVDDYDSNAVDADYEDGYRYDEYSNAFIDDEDFSAHERKKRRGFFDRFRRNKDEEDDTMDSPQQWLGMDEDFEARSVGRARGGWESFRQDYDDDISDPFSDDGHDDFGDFDNGPSRRNRGRRWEGGSYSRVSLGRVDNRSGVDAPADEGVPDAPPETEKDRFITGEIERIYHFRNPAFNTEVWFVAMGCDNDSHDGVRAFLNEHRSELRGSMIIEVESLGAGDLSVASHEGATKKVGASTRIKRYTREAVAATGIPLNEVDLSGTDSIASIIQEAGFQSMHLFGAENGGIALKGSADDVFENVNEFTLEENVRFIYELLKH